MSTTSVMRICEKIGSQRTWIFFFYKIVNWSSWRTDMIWKNWCHICSEKTECIAKGRWRKDFFFWFLLLLFSILVFFFLSWVITPKVVNSCWVSSDRQPLATSNNTAVSSIDNLLRISNSLNHCRRNFKMVQSLY